VSYTITHLFGGMTRGGTDALEFENLYDEGVGPRHMRRVERDQVLRFWKAVARGDHDELEKEAWKVGYR